MDAEAPRVGRPRASSRETLAEAACELFLEKGFLSTSVSDITTRAGVSRSSFFNYFSSKGDLVWAGFDLRLDEACRSLTQESADVREVLAELTHDLAPDSLALAIIHVDAMGIADELDRERAVRQLRLAHAVAGRLRSGGAPSLAAEVQAAALAGAVFAAVWAWGQAGAGRRSLAETVHEALDLVPTP